MCVHWGLYLVLYSSQALPVQGKDDDSIVENLKKEVQVLKSRFDMQEKVIEELKSRCETHERVLEMVRQEIVRLHDSQNSLNTTYHGESYDLMP